MDIASFDGKVNCFPFLCSNICSQARHNTQATIMSGIELKLPMQCAQPPAGITSHVEMHEKISPRPFDHF